MVEIIEFPGLIAELVTYLESRVTARGKTATVSHRVPTPRPASLIRLSHAGGNQINIRQRQVRLLVECWNTSEPAAERLANFASGEIEAATRMREAISPGVWISASPEDFSAPVNFSDPVSGSPRFQFYCNLVLTGSAI